MFEKINYKMFRKFGFKILYLFRISNFACLPACPAGRPARRGFRIFKSGFTLLETVIALGVITAAVVGPVYLITRGIFSASFSKNKLIASNLAQEGIESVRAVRDNNIICSFLGQSNWNWLKSSNGSGSLLGANQAADPTQTDSIQCGPDPGPKQTLVNPRISNDCAPVLKLNAEGRYGYGGIQNTAFSRCLTIAQAAAAEGNIPVSEILEITSTVSWSERGNPFSIVLKEKIYDWK